MMKPTLRHLSAAIAATIALAQPQIALAQQCVDQDDVADATVYAMPLLASAFTGKCSDKLAADGFMMTSGDAFVARYAELQDQKWAGAYRLLLSFAAEGKGGGPMAEMMANLPEESVRPFVDAIIEQKVADEIKVKDCAKIERGIEMLAPLPPENMGGLLAFIMDMSGVDKPSLCAYEPK